MRVTYIQPSSSHFDEVFTIPIRGGGIQDIRVYKPNYHSRGGSLFGVIGGLLRRSLPFIRGIIAPEFGNFVKNVVQDVDNSVPLRTSVKKNFIKATKNVGKRIVRGGGSKKKNKISKVKKRKAKQKKTNCHNDIFTTNRYEF